MARDVDRGEAAREEVRHRRGRGRIARSEHDFDRDVADDAERERNGRSVPDAGAHHVETAREEQGERDDDPETGPGEDGRLLGGRGKQHEPYAGRERGHEDA